MRYRSISAALALGLAIAPFASSQAAPAAASRPAAPDASGPAAARAALAKAASTELAAKLDEAIAPLSIRDSISIVDEFLPKLASADRSAFLVKTAGMALLMGGFSDACARYESAASLAAGAKDPSLLLKAGRCALAAGDVDKATELSALVLASGADAAPNAGARLVGAWALAFRGRASDALAIAAAVATAPSLPSELRREARFLAWLCSPKADKAKAAAALASDFPGSPEALVAAGVASTPPLPHWYLGELGALKGPASAQAAAPAKAAPVAAAPAPAAPAKAAPAAAAVAKAAPAATAPAVAATLAPAKAAPAQAEAKPATSPTAAPSSSSPKPAASAAAPAAAAPSAAATESLGRLQVGYFSVEENAKRLASELKSKGFSAIVEARSRTAGAASTAADRRWIVLVEAGADPSATMRSLKDAGYESYGVE